MAPPITVDIMAFLLCRKNIASGKPQQGDRYRRGVALALPMPLLSRYGLHRDTGRIRELFHASIPFLIAAA
jgi:hypothetical protein